MILIAECYRTFANDDGDPRDWFYNKAGSHFRKNQTNGSKFASFFFFFFLLFFFFLGWITKLKDQTIQKTTTNKQRKRTKSFLHVVHVFPLRALFQSFVICSCRSFPNTLPVATAGHSRTGRCLHKVVIILLAMKLPLLMTFYHLPPVNSLSVTMFVWWRRM